MLHASDRDGSLPNLLPPPTTPYPALRATTCSIYLAIVRGCGQDQAGIAPSFNITELKTVNRQSPHRMSNLPAGHRNLT